MALNDLLTKMEARQIVTSETPHDPREVSGNAAPITACTLDASVTPANDEYVDFSVLDDLGARVKHAIDADDQARRYILQNWDEIELSRWPDTGMHLNRLARKYATTPRGPVQCGSCRHFVPDSVGDGTGIGSCGIRAPASEDVRCPPLFPGTERFCESFSQVADENNGVEESDER